MTESSSNQLSTIVIWIVPFLTGSLRLTVMHSRACSALPKVKNTKGNKNWQIKNYISTMLDEENWRKRWAKLPSSGSSKSCRHMRQWCLAQVHFLEGKPSSTYIYMCMRKISSYPFLSRGPSVCSNIISLTFLEGKPSSPYIYMCMREFSTYPSLSRGPWICSDLISLTTYRKEIVINVHKFRKQSEKGHTTCKDVVVPYMFSCNSLWSKNLKVQIQKPFS
jgi:hypothetical protein